MHFRFILQCIYSHVNHIVLYSPRCLNVPLTGCSGRWSGPLLVTLYYYYYSSWCFPPYLLSSTEDDLWPPPLLVYSRSIQSSSGRFLCFYFFVTDTWAIVKLSFLVDLAQNVFFHSLWAGNDRRHCDKDLWSWSNGNQVDI